MLIAFKDTIKLVDEHEQGERNIKQILNKIQTQERKVSEADKALRNFRSIFDQAVQAYEASVETVRAQVETLKQEYKIKSADTGWFSKNKSAKRVAEIEQILVKMQNELFTDVKEKLRATGNQFKTELMSKYTGEGFGVQDKDASLKYEEFNVGRIPTGHTTSEHAERRRDQVISETARVLSAYKTLLDEINTKGGQINERVRTLFKLEQ